MSSAILMPKIGLTMTEGKIVEWRKGVGDRIEVGETIFVFETEKVTYEVDATQAGTVSNIFVGEGETVAVGTEVATLGSAAAKKEARQSAEMAAMRANARTEAEEPTRSAQVNYKMGGAASIRATPLARRIAKANNVDLARVAATASLSVVKRRDVEQFIVTQSSTAHAKQAVVESRLPKAGPVSEGRLVKLSSMREAIARKMMQSTTGAAQAYMVVSVDAGNLVEARQRLIPSIEKQTGVKPTLTDLLAKIVSVAISRHPIMNTTWTPEGVLWLDRIHMGIATALDDGLVVPVIVDIGTKKLTEIAVERNELVQLARSGRMPPDKMKGSTFSISSLGMFGVEEFSAIINQPESAILAVGAIIDTPVVREDKIVVRPIMKLTLTYDHRIIDGAKAAAFIATLKDVVEEPLLALA